MAFAPTGDNPALTPGAIVNPAPEPDLSRLQLLIQQLLSQRGGGGFGQHEFYGDPGLREPVHPMGVNPGGPVRDLGLVPLPRISGRRGGPRPTHQPMQGHQMEPMRNLSPRMQALLEQLLTAQHIQPFREGAGSFGPTPYRM